MILPSPTAPEVINALIELTDNVPVAEYNLYNTMLRRGLEPKSVLLKCLVYCGFTQANAPNSTLLKLAAPYFI